MKRLTRTIVIFVKLLGESFGFAMSSVRADKTRAFLSLLGVTIGIFSIVAVFTTIDSLKGNIQNSLAALGSDVVYIMQFPWQLEEGETEYKWWEYRQRPVNKYEEFIALQQQATTAEAVALSIDFSKEVKYGRNAINSVTISGITSEWTSVSTIKIGEGRYFSQIEANGSQNVAVVGFGVADELFKGEDPIGKVIKIAGNNSRVIGVLEEEGSGGVLSITMYDQAVLIPYLYACTMVDPRMMGPTIVAKKRESANKDDFLGELKTILRNVRRLKPTQKDNFSINEMSIVQDVIDQIFGTINLVGWIIGGFSILIGGFGVANIMFVSVKERTNVIGIQKALGAKNYFIMTQFLFEAALLAIMGGIVGILIVYGGILFVSHTYNFIMTLTLGNIIRGVIVSSAIGLAAGIIPAYMAAHLNPVDAINSK
ncbi:MAG: ABC transporter permease [Prevotellaceae bacterium]|jgi:putative ABC transport system permease protein|nr:ABC transporter permease [Prevotellaceae bacterium]